jgi:hypothetical protein
MPRLRSHTSNETLIDFLGRELPPRARDQAEFFASAVKEAGERYDRYSQRRDDWWKFSRRRERLRKIKQLTESLSAALCALDILNRDELDSRIGPEKIEYLIGLLNLLHREADVLDRRTQASGKPIDHATQRWILQLADIYENAFGKQPSVSGSGEDPVQRRGKFYRLLELARPASFARHGRLTTKHIQSLLKTRRPLLSLQDLLPRVPQEGSPAGSPEES